MSIIQQAACRLPVRWQNELKRIHYRRQIRKGSFVTSEPEYRILSTLITHDDWIIDVGANVGHYTMQFSELVGAGGRVIAFEPVPATFALLASNVSLFAWPNVTLINAAVSDDMASVGMSIPRSPSGQPNYYQAHLTAASDRSLSVLALSIDDLNIQSRIALIKIDAEGHEVAVLRGMQRLLAQHHPVLIVETGSPEVIALLADQGYTPEKLHGSPNLLFKVKE